MSEPKKPGPKEKSKEIPSMTARVERIRAKKEARDAAIAAVLPIQTQRALANLMMALPANATMVIPKKESVARLALPFNCPIADAPWTLPANAFDPFVAGTFAFVSISLPLSDAAIAGIERYVRDRAMSASSAEPLPDQAALVTPEPVKGVEPVKVAAPVEAPKPAKKPRAKKPRAKAVEPSPVEEAAARPGLWLLVEHPVGAAPVEMRHEERLARRFFEATAKHGGDGLRRVELFDDMGLLVDSHNYPTPSQPARSPADIPATVPAHLRDLAALTSPGWWCVVAQPAVRPDLTEAKLCTDESTAVATAASLRAADDGSNSLTRVVVFNADGAVHTAWHRHEPAVSAVVEAHQGVELFRVTVGAASIEAGTPPAEWGACVAPCRFADNGQSRNSPAEVAEGAFALHWHPDVGAHEVYAIVPRGLVAIVARRCATWGGWNRPPSVTPELDAPSTALRAGSSVVVGGETWAVLLVDHERAVLTRGDDIAEVALGDVHPSGTDAGWWADRVRSPKAEKKAPKRAKAVA